MAPKPLPEDQKRGSSASGVSLRLTQSERATVLAACDGRPIATVARRLLLEWAKGVVEALDAGAR